MQLAYISETVIDRDIVTMVEDENKIVCALLNCDPNPSFKVTQTVHPIHYIFGYRLFIGVGGANGAIFGSLDGVCRA